MHIISTRCCGDWKCRSLRVLWGFSHRIVLLMDILYYVFVVSFITAIFRWWQIMRLNHLYFTPGYWEVNLNYGKIIDNKADKKCQGMTSICCNLWTTKETYQKLLWYRFYTTLCLRSASPFWIGFYQNLVFYCNSTLVIFFFKFFFYQNCVPVLLVSLEWNLCMEK
jgi:hypothetical protein